MQDYTYRDFDIIDSHAHIFPAAIAEKAAKNIGVFYDLPSSHVGSPECLLEQGGKFGVKKYLVCSVATLPRQVRDINNFIARECAEHPEFFGFGTLHPLMDGLEDEINRIIEMGLHGIKLHPDFQEFDLDSKEAYAMYEMVNGRLPFLLHMGDKRYTYSSPERLARVLDNMPKLQVIAAHFGGYNCWESAEGLLKRPGVKVDTSSSLFALDKEYVIKLINHYGVENCFFGTDFPLMNYPEEIKSFMNLGLPYEDAKKILSLNFREYFKI